VPFTAHIVEHCPRWCRESDVVSLHLPLIPSTHHLINKERLMMMKQQAILINVSRGAMVDTRALIDVRGVWWVSHSCTWV
jgi:lactate dehydrogenase-like 2-hydroxyacid dehydrogenase